jgi:hypothetical protein
MHVAPPAIRIVVVPVGVTVLLGLCNPPSFTIAPGVDFLLCYRIDQAA